MPMLVEPCHCPPSLHADGSRGGRFAVGGTAGSGPVLLTTSHDCRPSSSEEQRLREDNGAKSREVKEEDSDSIASRRLQQMAPNFVAVRSRSLLARSLSWVRKIQVFEDAEVYHCRDQDPFRKNGPHRSRLANHETLLQPFSGDSSAQQTSNPSWISTLFFEDGATAHAGNGFGIGISRGMHGVRYQHTHSDEWLAQRWLADKKRREAQQRRLKTLNRTTFDNVNDVDHDPVYMKGSQSDHSSLNASSEEKLAGVLGRPDLIITRNVEWANLAFGFEQQNKYVIMDPRNPQAPVGYILEDSNIFMRQFLRRRRPFVAQVLDAYGNQICLVQRPVWLINSTIYVEVDGKIVGEAHRRWHLWRRIYDVYLGKKQFASVENPGFWHWTFTLQDQNQGVLAVIDRNWRGFGFEFLTDAGQYVVRFGDLVPNYIRPAFGTLPSSGDIRKNNRPVLAGSPSASSEISNLQAAAEAAEHLVVDRPLSLLERAVTLALAVSLDNDYFSNHSSGMGFIPLPFFGGSEAVDSVAPDNETSRYAESSPIVTSSEASDGPEGQHVVSSDDSDGKPLRWSWMEEEVEEAIVGESSKDSSVDETSQDDEDILVDPFDILEQEEW